MGLYRHSLHIVPLYLHRIQDVVGHYILWKAPIFGTIYSGVGHCSALLHHLVGKPLSTTRCSAPYLLHTPTSYILYLILIIIYILYYILWLLRIFRPSPLRLYSILYVHISISTTSWVYTISCTYIYYYHYILSTALPRPFGLRRPQYAQRHPATAYNTTQSTTRLTACNPRRPARLRFSRSFRSTCKCILADPEKRHLAHFGISCIQTHTSTTISCTIPPTLKSVQLAQPTILW